MVMGPKKEVQAGKVQSTVVMGQGRKFKPREVGAYLPCMDGVVGVARAGKML